MARTDIAPPEPDRQTGGVSSTDTRDLDMAQTQTHQRSADEIPDPKPGRSWGTTAMVLAAVVLAALGLFLLFGPRGSTPEPTPAPAPSSAAPTPTTAATAAAEQQAYTDTQKVLNAWIANYDAAATPNLDSSKLDANLVTPEVLAAAKASLDRLSTGAAKTGTTAKYTTDVRGVTPISYSATKVELATCAVRETRFFQNGKDVTVDQNGQPHPPATTPLVQVTGFTKNETGWKISTFQLDADAGAKC